MPRRRYIYVDSSDRLNGTSSDFTFKLGTSIIGVNNIRLESARIPFSFYMVDSYTQIPFEEQAGGGLTYAPIPAGNYSQTTFAAAVKTALDTASPNGQTYTVTYDTTTLKYTITSTANVAFLWTSGAQDFNYSYYNLGFNDASTLSIPDPDTAQALSHTSSGVPCLSWPALWLQLGPQIPCDFRTSEGTAICAVIPTTGNSSDWIAFDANSQYRVELYLDSLPVSLATMHVRLRLPDGRICDLNGVEMSLVISYTLHGDKSSGN